MATVIMKAFKTTLVLLLITTISVVFASSQNAFADSSEIAYEQHDFLGDSSRAVQLEQ